jgi:hypothetical protein
VGGFVQADPKNITVESAGVPSLAFKIENSGVIPSVSTTLNVPNDRV